jgi:hypothetical protein
MLNFFKNTILNRKVISAILVFAIMQSFLVFLNFKTDPKAEAVSRFDARGGELIAGAETTVSKTNTGSWKGTLGKDSIF